MENENNRLSAMRHSLAHILAAAILEKYPGAKRAIGPAIDTGFYYDFEFPEGNVPSPDDLSDIEKRMRAIIKKNLPFAGREVSADEAKDIFADEPYKRELIDEFSAKGEKLTVYETGDYIDLCRGGHVKNTSEIPADAFALSHIAGAYWRGDENNTMLTRIYGLAFENKEALQRHRDLLEEAKRRDHRKIGRELDLFTFSDLVGSGLPLFTPKGTAMREAIVAKIRRLQEKRGYESVWIPHITKKDLYEKSGHWEKFGDELFKVTGAHGGEFALKPMNCPHHTQIYASRQRSKRDLPLRYAETTAVYRDEKAGELLGLSRVRAITQDDAHIFCAPEHIESEVKSIVAVIKEFYTSLRMWNEEAWVSVSVRGPEEEGYLGDRGVWEKSESILSDIAESIDLPAKRVEGEAAFYGPKLDFMFKDALGRERQLATVQLDFVMPERFGLEYIDAGEKKTPVMIHRAIAGSLERFLSVIIEHFAGAFPVWLSPVQARVLSIGEKHKEYGRKVFSEIRRAGLRAELDDSDETLGKKIREAKREKIPYLLVIGDAEVKNGTVTAESRDKDSLGEMPVEEFIDIVRKEIN